jgi:hypothetical protein
MDTMDHTLINPNQLRHYGTRVQDNPMSSHPLSIITEDHEFCMELSMEGTIIFANTNSPLEHELNSTCPHISLSSPQPWNPMRVRFLSSTITLEEEIGGMRYLSGVKAHHDEEQELFPEDYSNFCLESINRTIASMKTVVQDKSTCAETPLTRDESIDPGISDVPVVNTFQSSGRHSDVTPNNL